MKHNWKKNKDGSIDEYAWEYEFHSGVVCEDCGRCVSITTHLKMRGLKEPLID